MIWIIDHSLPLALWERAEVRAAGDNQVSHAAGQRKLSGCFCKNQPEAYAINGIYGDTALRVAASVILKQ